MKQHLESGSTIGEEVARETIWMLGKYDVDLKGHTDLDQTPVT